MRRNIVLEFLAVAGAGALGSMARLAVGRLFGWASFPVGTLVINVTGSMFLGWFLTVMEDPAKTGGSNLLRLAVATGFVGAYTTFSTYTFESNTLMQKGAALEAVIYILGSVLLGLIAVRCGIWLGQKA